MEQDLELQELRSKATEFLLREDYNSSIKSYTQLITLYQQKISKTHKKSDLITLQKSLCLSFSNRAESWFRLKCFDTALQDCQQALKIDNTHVKTLVCKGKILMNLDTFEAALDCFNAALKLDCGGYLEELNGLVAKCRKLDSVSRTGNFDISSWICGGFNGKFVDLCEFVGNVEIKRSEISGRGLFCTKNVEVGGLILVTKAVATERCILPKGFESGLSEGTQLVMWKNFVEKVVESVSKCAKTRSLIGTLSNGEGEEVLEVPDISVFRGASEECLDLSNEEFDVDKILSILDVNSIVEEGFNAKVLGKNSELYGVGLWLLPCFINHSCSPNARRLHVGDYMVVLASREIKAGEEIMFSYFDVLQPLRKRKEMAKSWGFSCQCKRCLYEEKMQDKPEMGEIEKGVDDVGCAVFRLEECMRRWVVRGKEKGYLRASFWKAFSEAYESEKVVRRWGRKIPALESVVDSLVEAVGCDERVVKVLVRKLKKSGCGFGEMERAMKLGRGVYGKVMKKQALRILLELGVHD